MLRLFAMLVVAVLLTFSSAQAADFTLASPLVEKGFTAKEIFNGFGCTGENVSPALSWANAPAGTKSFAVTLHDPDAPTGGSGWWHWVLFNIPATVTGLEAGVGLVGGELLPVGTIQSVVDFGLYGYGGPCPPVGDKPHRYVFTVYALKDKLALGAMTMPALVGFMINANKLGQASFEIKYGR